MTVVRPAELSGLPDRYGDLFDRAMTVFQADTRIRAVWLHGACGRGAADAGSDLDLSVAVRDADHEQFAAQWRDWLADITPTVVARPTGDRGFSCLTPTCERLDVVVSPVGELPTTGWTLRRRVVLFDRDGLDARIPAPDDPPPDPDRIAWIIEEVLRQQANFPTVRARQDWLLGQVAVQQIHLHLYELYAEANRPMPGMGPKQWSAKLTPAQRAVLSALPVPSADARSVYQARDEAIVVFVREAKAVAAANGVEWPVALETAVRDYLASEGLSVGPTRALRVLR
ncbi:MAG: nucleotidyltransferase domain-containing protein [Actinocatenispora sp.]